MKYYVRKRTNGKIEGIFSAEEILQRVARKEFDENDLLIEAKGQSSFQLKSSTEWATINKLMSSLQSEVTSMKSGAGKIHPQIPNDTFSVEPEDKFKTLSGHGTFLLFFGWLVILIGTILAIALSQKIGITGTIIICAMSVLSGISFVVSGQMVACFISIEKNGRITNEMLKRLQR